jgi:hypothetical protein
MLARLDPPVLSALTAAPVPWPIATAWVLGEMASTGTAEPRSPVIATGVVTTGAVLSLETWTDDSAPLVGVGDEIAEVTGGDSTRVVPLFPASSPTAVIFAVDLSVSVLTSEVVRLDASLVGVGEEEGEGGEEFGGGGGGAAEVGGGGAAEVSGLGCGVSPFHPPSASSV